MNLHFNTLRVSEELTVGGKTYRVTFLLCEKALEASDSPRKSFYASLEAQGLVYHFGNRTLFRAFADAGLLKALEERLISHLPL
jgi:hypothetical protein